MSSMLKNAAMAAISKGAPSSYYDGDDNPVLQSLDQELKLYMTFMQKRAMTTIQSGCDSSDSRASDTLFNIWNKYKHRLTQQYYEEKLLEVGDLLVALKEYKIALWQCYSRYLHRFGEFDLEEITDVDTFKKLFFRDGFTGRDADLTFRALLGRSICAYQSIKRADPHLQNRQSADSCLQILAFLRLVTQVVLPHENLCWLVYNGTIYIYSVARHLMSLGHSAKVLEFLLWASVCMETSVPLLSVKYLAWRSTLYTAVCQCYYDCRQGQHAEGFARRGLSKINELSQLECMSNSTESIAREMAFRHATIKMGAMIYKRSAFESRRKPRGFLRPKSRANLKEVQGLPWPRTTAEKALAEMFEGSAAQFLCILETLSDSNRRTVVTSPPAPDSEVEILDVYAELFMAGQEIIMGGGGAMSSQTGQQSSYPTLAAVVDDRNLMDMAVQAVDGVTVSSVIRFTKLAYSYEYFDLFSVLAENLIIYLKGVDESKYSSQIKEMELLQAMLRLSPAKKIKKLVASQADDHSVKDDRAEAKDASSKDSKEKENKESKEKDSSKEGEEEGDKEKEDGQEKAESKEPAEKSGSLTDIMNLSRVLLSIMDGDFNRTELDGDVLVDCAIIFWTKCKTMFQKYQTGSIDNTRYLSKMDNAGKWMYMLHVCHRFVGWCGLGVVDPALCAEVALRCAFALESSSTVDDTGKKLTKRDAHKHLQGTSQMTHYSLRDGGQSECETPQNAAATNLRNKTSLLHLSPREKLEHAKEILGLGLENVSAARQATALTDGNSLADVCWVKEFNPDDFTPVKQEPLHETDDLENLDTSHGTAVGNTVQDLHLELLYLYHRVGIKLIKAQEAEVRLRELHAKTAKVPVFAKGRVGVNFESLVKGCGKNLLSKALLYMQKAVVLGTGGKPGKEQTQLIEESMNMITRAGADERRLHQDNALSPSPPDGAAGRTGGATVPPPPVLLCRTDQMMIFRPAPFNPKGEKVAWYRLFGKAVSGSNVKARLNDYNLMGSGQQIPAHKCELRVSGLSTNERYVFAVAAYTAEGKLIGASVGESTRAILASHPLPVLSAWAFLAQVAYQVGCYQISQHACRILLDHFIAQPEPDTADSYISKNKKDFALTLYRLNRRVIRQTSPVLLRQFLNTLFINVDIRVKESGLYCDALCDRGPSYQGQLARLKECERMLVALELAGWLNEANLALQACVQCYGLLAPIIYYKIPSVHAVQILERCFAVLQEIPVTLRQRRQVAMTENLHHMTACLTYYLARVLRTWQQKLASSSINEIGRKLLAIDLTNVDPPKIEDDAKKRVAPPRGKNKNRDDSDGSNEELKALEAHMMRLSKQSQAEHDLTGNEDPNVLHSYITFLPSRVAYKEVSKFRRRNRFLEFFVQVAHKAVCEGNAELAMEWCEETTLWLLKRNESIIGPRTVYRLQTAYDEGDGEEKKYVATMVAYTKDGRPAKESETPAAAAAAAAGGAKQQKAARKVKKPKPKWKPSTYREDPAALAAEESRQNALDILSQYLPDAVRTFMKRKKLRRICADELPWRAQLFVVQAESQFSVFLHKVDTMDKLSGTSTIHKTSYLDQEWFTFDASGTMLVNWDGGPSRQATRQEQRNDHASSPGVNAYKTGIEAAQIAALGSDPATMLVPGHDDDDDDDSPRTYRSDVSPGTVTKVTSLKLLNAQEDAGQLMSSRKASEMLIKVFDYYRKAVVCSHRGQHWTLLQNVCRAMWNCLHTALLKISSSTQNPSGFLDARELRCITWKTLYVAADALLDMLHSLLNEVRTQAAKVEKKGGHVEPVTGLLGGAEDEKGGASLKYDMLDDLSTVDTRGVRRVVLRALEMLYHENKWESLIHIGLKFNALSNYRYAEQVSPLVVLAQHKLSIQTVQHGGQPAPQPAFSDQQQALGRPVTSTLYLDLQLRVKNSLKQLATADPGAEHGDPHDLFAPPGAAALQHISVPLDTVQSLKEFHEALNKSHYTARALGHSRRLLLLYLASQQSDVDAMTPGLGRVDFIPTTAQPPTPMPPDLERETFQRLDDVQSMPLPRSQLSVVVSSYTKTIELLMAKNHKSLAAQAMKELADLYFHTGNVRSACTWWSDALDLLVGKSDVIDTWRHLVAAGGDPSRQLLERCGLWGCLFAGVLTVNFARYVVASDLGKRKDLCLLAGHFFKASFRASMPHPLVDRDYADYEVGEGCDVTTFLPGVDLLSDKFRADGRTVIEALRWLVEELTRCRQYLFVLPLLSLSQYFTASLCRDVQRSVAGRIIRVRVLTDLGLYSEAVANLLRLLHGERLPSPIDGGYRQPETRSGSGSFDTSKPMSDRTNRKYLRKLYDKRLSMSLGALYGPHLTCQLTLVHAHLMIELADRIPIIPMQTEGALFDAAVGGGKVAEVVEPVQKTSKELAKEKGVHKASIRPQKGTDEANTSRPDDDSDADADQTLTPDVLKTMLLTTAAQLVTTVSEGLLQTSDIKDAMANLSCAEVEVVIQCKLELAAISHQYHHANMASRTVLSALHMLQLIDEIHEPAPTSVNAVSTASGRGSKPKKARSTPTVGKHDNHLFRLYNAQARSRLDSRLWLTCRLQLVKYLLGEIRGMGDIKGPDRTVVQELADCRRYCTEGIQECRTLGDVEMSAEFMLQGVILDILDSRADSTTKINLADTLEVLSGVVDPSPPVQFQAAYASILTVDLWTVANMEATCLEDALRQMFIKYKTAQDLILVQIQELGETIEHHRPADHQRSYLDGPTSPVRNLYLPHVTLLTQVKFRIGHTMARIATVVPKLELEEQCLQWGKCLGVLYTALELNKISIDRQANLEADILLNIGKIERQLYYRGRYSQRAVISTFLQAIKTSYCYDHDLSLIRQAYLEMALTWFHELPSGAMIVSRQTTVVDSAESSEDSTMSAESPKKRSKRLSKKDRKNKQVKEDPTEKEKRAAWTCIRAAAACGHALRMRRQIMGDSTVTSHPVERTAIDEVPVFVLFDLLGSYALGKRKQIFRNEIEEELSTMPEFQEQHQLESYMDQIEKVKMAATDFSWVFLLGYQNNVHRVCNTASVSNALITETENYLDRFGGEETQPTPGSSFDVVRTPIYAGRWAMRLAHLHVFLADHLQSYTAQCCAPYPPAQVEHPLKDAPAPPCDVPVPWTRYDANKTVPELDADGQIPPEPTPPGLNDKALRPPDKPVIQPNLAELCLQWYRPSLDTPPSLYADPDEAEPSPERVVLLYALNKKAERNTGAVAGANSSRSSFPYEQLTQLYSKLALLAQKADLSLPDAKPSTGTAASRKESSAVTPAARKKVQRIKPLSPRARKVDDIEALLRQCVAEIRLFLGINEKMEAGELAETESADGDGQPRLPFEMNKANAASLEKLFHSGYGYTLRGSDLLTWLNKLFPLPLQAE